MDFSNLEYNPLELSKDEMIWEKYPDLSMNPVFCEPSHDLTFEELSHIVSFVILFVDVNSPVYKETDMERRTKVCIDTLKISKASPAYKSIITHDERFSKVMYEYFRWVNNLPFQSWLSLKLTVTGLYKYLSTDLGIEDVDLEADRRAKIQERLIGLEKKLLEKQSKLFPTKRIQDIINRENIKDQLTGYAEMYALDHPVLNPS